MSPGMQISLEQIPDIRKGGNRSGWLGALFFCVGSMFLKSIKIEVMICSNVMVQHQSAV